MQGIGGGGGGTKRKRREQKAEAQNGSTMGGQKADNSTKREATLGRVRPPSAHPLLEQHSEPLEETPWLTYKPHTDFTHDDLRLLPQSTLKRSFLFAPRFLFSSPAIIFLMLLLCFRVAKWSGAANKDLDFGVHRFQNRIKAIVAGHLCSFVDTCRTFWGTRFGNPGETLSELEHAALGGVSGALCG